MKSIELSHDPRADAVYVRLSDAPFARTEQLDDARRIDYAADGSPVRVEILDVSRGADVAGLPEADEIAAHLRRIDVRLRATAEMEAEVAADPALQRTALARAVAVAVNRYRAEHGLSLRALARRLGMPAPNVVRLESGERNPSIDTLQRLSGPLGLRFVVDVSPEGAATTPLPVGVQLVEDRPTPDGGRLRIATG